MQSSALPAGYVIGNYKLVRKIGQGGTSSIYEAVNQSGDKKVAIKILDAKKARQLDAVQRFLDEARAVKRVQHRGLVNVFEFGKSPEGQVYIVMALLDGLSLSDSLREKRALALAPALWVLRQVAQTVAAAHACDIVHCDLKPDNIFLVRGPDLPERVEVKVLDFGAARYLGPSGPTDSEMQTRRGVWLGTPPYMAPEQFSGLEVTTDRADVYSLGVMLHQLLSGRLPFEGDSYAVLMMQVDGPPPLSCAGRETPGALAALALAMLNRLPSSRPSMAEVEAALGQLLDTLLAEELAAVKWADELPLRPPGPEPETATEVQRREPTRLAVERWRWLALFLCLLCGLGLSRLRARAAKTARSPVGQTVRAELRELRSTQPTEPAPDASGSTWCDSVAPLLLPAASSDEPPPVEAQPAAAASTRQPMPIAMAKTGNSRPQRTRRPARSKLRPAVANRTSDITERDIENLN